MHPEIEDLSRTIQEAADFLLSVGEQHWGNWLAKDAALIRNSDFRGVEHILNAFGGMGSINDLIIHPINGHSVSEDQISTAKEPKGHPLSPNAKRALLAVSPSLQQKK